MSIQVINVHLALVALMTVLCATSACVLDKCGSDFLGSTSMTISKQLKRKTLDPYNSQQYITVHSRCNETQGVLAYACGQDIEPLVKVISYKEVMVQRNSAPWPGIDVTVDITVFCRIPENSLPPKNNKSVS